MHTLRHLTLLFTFCLGGILPHTASGTEPTEKSHALQFESLLTKARQLKQKPGTGPIVIPIPPGNYILEKPILITEKDSGTKERPIIFKVTDPAHTSFSSATDLPPFKQDSHGTWTCQLLEGVHLDELLINTRPAPIARLPHTGYFTIQNVQQTVTEVGSNKRFPLKATQTITPDADAATALSQLTPTELHNTRMTVLHNWDSSLVSGIGFDPDKKSILTRGRGMKSWNPWKKGSRFFLQNASVGSLPQGHWIQQDRTLTYAPKKGETLKNTTFTAPRLKQLLIIRGQKNNPVNHITFDGFRWRHSALDLPNGMPPNQAASIIDAAMMIDHASNIHFTNNHLSHLGRYAIWFREDCHHCSLTSSLVSDLGAGGVRIGETHLRSQTPTSHITIKNNIIRKGGRQLPCAVGVWIGQSGDNRIIHNDIHDFYYTGISVGWTWGYGKSYAKNNKILSNHIHHIGQGMLSDMGAVYCLGVSPGTEVSGNIIHDVQSHGYGGWGLYTDEGSTGITMENNLVYRTKCGGFHQHYGKENTLRNNIFVDATLYQIQATRPEKHLSFTFTHNIISFKKGTLYQGPFFSIQSHIDHNLIWNPDPKKLTQKSSRFFGGKNFEAWKEKGHGVHSIIGDPQFANPEKDDYTPQNKALLQKIGFKDFSSSQAGVPANIRRTLTPSASAN